VQKDWPTGFLNGNPQAARLSIFPTISMAHIYDLDDYKLETTFQGYPQPNIILHTSYRADRARGIRKVAVVDQWAHQKPELGVGTFGTVRLEKKLNNRDEGQTFRAVKQLQKSQMARLRIDYRKELIALTKFSRSKVRVFFSQL
jgi:hypothetical protein